MVLTFHQAKVPHIDMSGYIDIPLALKLFGYVTYAAKIIVVRRLFAHLMMVPLENGVRPGLVAIANKRSGKWPGLVSAYVSGQTRAVRKICARGKLL